MKGQSAVISLVNRKSAFVFRTSSSHKIKLCSVKGRNAMPHNLDEVKDSRNEEIDWDGENDLMQIGPCREGLPDAQHSSCRKLETNILDFLNGHQVYDGKCAKGAYLFAPLVALLKARWSVTSRFCLLQDASRLLGRSKFISSSCLYTCLRLIIICFLRTLHMGRMRLTAFIRAWDQIFEAS